MSESGTRIEALHERCMGAGNCADLDGTVMVLREVVDAEDEAMVSGAVNICPVSALSLKVAVNGSAE